MSRRRLCLQQCIRTTRCLMLLFAKPLKALAYRRRRSGTLDWSGTANWLRSEALMATAAANGGRFGN